MNKIIKEAFSKDLKEATRKNVKKAFLKGWMKYRNLNHFEGDTIIYEKQEDGKIINKIGLVKEILVKEAHRGEKINRYYIVKDEEGEYAVPENCVIHGNQKLRNSWQF
jgi:uncharacterized protein YaiL (DUF2058 family)